METPSETDLTGSRPENPCGEPRNVGKKDTKRIRELFASGIPAKRAKENREDFRIGFDHKSFDLICPELDDSLARRLRRVNSEAKTTAEATESR